MNHVALIVDANHETAIFTGRLLKSMGIEVIHTDSPALGGDFASSASILVIDPGTKEDGEAGIGLLAKLRAEGNYCPAVVIANGEYQKVNLPQASDFVTKPIDVVEFCKAIQRALRMADDLNEIGTAKHTIQRFRQSVTKAIVNLCLAVVLASLAGCGSAPEMTAVAAARTSDNYGAYADAVDRVAARWTDGLDEAEAKKTQEDLAVLSEALRADAANVKTENIAQRLEGLGSALTKIPIPVVQTSGWLIAGIAAAVALLARKKKPNVGGVGT